MTFRMKNNIFAVLQKIGRAFMLPIAVLPMAGILLGIGGSFTNPVLIKTYNLTFLESGTPLNYLMQLFSNTGLFVFANLPLLFAVGVAIGLANKNKETAALSAVLGFLLFHTIIGTILGFKGITPDSVTYDALIAKGLGEAAARGTAALYAKELGIFTLQTGVFGGIVCGIVASAITNKFSDKVLPDYLAFFSGNRFVPVMTIILFIPLAAIFHLANNFYGNCKSRRNICGNRSSRNILLWIYNETVKCIWIASRNISTVLVYSAWRISGSGRTNGSWWTEHILCTACRSINKTFQCGGNKNNDRRIPSYDVWTSSGGTCNVQNC